MEQFKFDIQLIFAILNGKVSTAINRKLHRNFRQEGIDISPEQWTILLSLWEKDGITQQDLCNATFKDKLFLLFFAFPPIFFPTKSCTFAKLFKQLFNNGTI